MLSTTSRSSGNASAAPVFSARYACSKNAGIVPAGGEHHCYAVGGDEIHGLAQQSWIIAIVAHTYVAEQAGRDSTFDIAGEQRIAGTGWNAQIVFQHPPLPVLPLHQVLAGDVREHPPPGGVTPLTCGK